MHRAHTSPRDAAPQPSLAPLPTSPARAASRRATRFTLAALVALAGTLAGCGSDSNPVKPTTTRVDGFSVAANPNDVLSALASFTATGADSARIVYWADSAPGGATPFAPPDSQNRIAVLGLRPQTTYHLTVEARAKGQPFTSDTTTFTTGTLPSFLQQVSMQSSAPMSGGYIVTAVGDSSSSFIVALDSAGRVAWYHEFDEGVPVVETKQQTNGDFTAFVGASHGSAPVPGRYVELSPAGDVVRTFTAQDSAYMDPHELWVMTNGGAYDGAVYLTYTARHLDLSAQGGPSDTLVTGHQIVREDASGAKHIVFDAWDHFAPGDNVEPIANESDFDHPNSLDFDADGNYIVSWRNFDAITKIDASSGQILWTFGGAHSDFTLSGDPLGGTSVQHCVRRLDDGNLLIFDNGTRHSPQESRAVEYSLDPSAKTATMVWQYTHAPSKYVMFTGSVQRLTNGDTFIGWTWGSPLYATEVGPSGNVVWEGTLQTPSNAASYRFTKIASLYRFEKP